MFRRSGVSGNSCLWILLVNAVLGLTGGFQLPPCRAQLLLLPNRHTTASVPSMTATAEPALANTRIKIRPTRPVQVPETYDGETLGVLLLNLGGPETLDEVEPFLYNLFADPEIITLPASLQWLNAPIAFAIAKTRAPLSKEGYASIGGGSPQLSTTVKQGEALEEALRAAGVNAKTYVAMRYWSPYTSDAVDAIKKDGVKRLVILPLYPQFSISTSGSSLRVLEKYLYDDPDFAAVKNTVIPAWYNREGYVNAMTALIEQSCANFDNPSNPQIFFSAHGLPETYIKDLGDPYQEQMEACVEFIMARMRELGYSNAYNLAYQSRVGPTDWLRPYTDDMIPELAKQGVKEMVVVPISFVSEHIETLEEIDMEYKELAEESGITRWERVPCLGLDQDFIQDLAAAILEALPKLDEPPAKCINEGSPVSLRVVNDLVELYKKEELQLVPQDKNWGWTPRAEVINGRIAMMAITLTAVGTFFGAEFTM